jgi:hypothetical protein
VICPPVETEIRFPDFSGATAGKTFFKTSGVVFVQEVKWPGPPVFIFVCERDDYVPALGGRLHLKGPERSIHVELLNDQRSEAHVALPQNQPAADEFWGMPPGALIEPA